ncbi:hypothetical protein BH18CHL2_BH18CHL2_08130 [soil metagenome]
MTELALFQTGAVELPRSFSAPWLPAREGEAKALHPVWSALVRTPEGAVLFDTGLHPVHIARPDATFGPRAGLRVIMRAEDAILSRLAALGVRPDDVAVVVNSHLHFDHAGNNGAFPSATFIVQRDHLAYARGKPGFPGVYWDIPGLRYIPVEGRTPVAPGVEVVPTPGHAPGHQSLVVDIVETGRVVLCGDAAFTRENLERGEAPQPDAASAARSLALIVTLVGGDLDRAFPSQDARSWESWRKAPDVYR